MERRLAVHARASRQVTLVAVALALAAGPAAAAPKGAAAKAAFQRGVKAYEAKDWAAASEALGESFALEADAETLFAWAQAERQLEHCEKAIELFGRLEQFDLPEENRQVVRERIEECKAKLPPPAPAISTEPPVPADEPPPAPPKRRRWYKDPIGLSLLGAGVVGVGVGTGFLVAASSADSAAGEAATYDEFVRLDDRAKSRGTVGVIGLSVGVAFAGAGVIWYLTRGGDDAERARVSGWIDRGGGGLAVTGSM